MEKGRSLTLFESQIKKHQEGFFLRRIEKLPDSNYLETMIDWAERKRYLPAGTTEFPGQFTRETAPHLVEPLELLHPDSDKQIITAMKSVQSAFTTSVGENGMGYWIDHKQGSILTMISTKGQAAIRSSSAIDVMIDKAGLKIKPMSQRMKRKTGDKSNYKEFAGNIKMLMSSYNSIADMKSNTFHFIFNDELDEMSEELKGQGDTYEIIKGRTMGLRRFKILNVSTPSNMSTSRIYKAFKEGDQRYFHMPCPHCGEKQVLELKSKGQKHGLTFTREKHETTGNKILIPESVRYICKHCGKSFHESKKQWMLENGIWIPSVVPEDRNQASFHVSGLMSPEMFLSWERICQQFVNADFGQDVLKFKDFTINYLGWPWANIQKAMAWEDFKNRADDYCYGEPPQGKITKIDDLDVFFGPLILVGGVDVQGDRLELHILGIGTGMELWSIDYKIFYGNPSNIDDTCWDSLSEHVYGTSYKISGEDILISKVSIDTGYDPRKAKAQANGDGGGVMQHVVHEFVAMREDRFIAIMGIAEEKSLDVIKEARIHGTSSLKKRYNISVSLIKDMLMNNVELLGGPRSIHFPKYTMTDTGQRIEIPDEHFKQFLSERYQELKSKKFGWEKIYIRNEVWDTFIYALATAYILNLPGKNIGWWAYHYQQIKLP